MDMMVRNVTEIFRQAIDSHTDWMISSFYGALERLEEAGVGVSFWQGEENWAAMGEGDVWRGYMWLKYPLVVVERSGGERLRALLGDFVVIQYLEVESVGEDLLCIDDVGLWEYLVGLERLDSFTGEELWFSTVT